MRRRAVLLLTLMMVALLVVASPAWAAEFTVTNTEDPGNGTCNAGCTLREAITAANATSDEDTIKFNIPGSGVKTISLGSALPTIINPVTIDGYTQPGASPNTLAVGDNAVLLIELNGTSAGTGPDANGLVIQASGSTIKGLVINRFDSRGIVVEGFNTTGNKVEGNFIGTNAAGTSALGNIDGVDIQSADNTTVGGTLVSARNVISGNRDAGIQIVGDSATNNKVLGNYVGTDKNGTSDLGNSGEGVHISDARDSTIGGTASGARNVISGNNFQGVHIQSLFDNPTGNKVEGNFVGTDANGTVALGNGEDGVQVAGADDNIVGGTAGGAGNRIAHNGTAGVSVIVNGAFGVEGAVGNRVLGNSIFSNTGLGIDLGDDGVTANDPRDPDTGANNLQNFPEVTTAKPIKKRVKGKRRPFTVIAGTLNSTPNTTFTIQLFRNLSGEDEGRILLTQFPSVTTDADGNASFSIRVRRSRAPVGSAITATATNNPTGDTSEFSAAKSVG